MNQQSSINIFGRMKSPHGSAILIVAMSSALWGCAVGPDFKRPAAPDAKGYAPNALPATTASAEAAGGAAQSFNSDRDIPAQWWTLFQSQPLNSLIKRALQANPSIEIAQATLRQAQEQVYAQQGFFFPTITGSYSPSRQKLAGNMGGNSPGPQGDGSVIASTPSSPAIYNYHTAQLTVGYTVDVFGGNRRQVESLKAQAEAEQFQLEAANLTVASNVVAAALQEASIRAQIEATREIIRENEKSVEIVGTQVRLGYAARADLAAQETALAQARQLLPPLEKQFEQTRDLIRVLAGNLPSQDVDETFELSDIHLPEELPVSLPSQLVQQRPDVRMAEAQMHSASAEVGVAVANRFPQFTISAALGGQGSAFNEMFKGGGPFWSLAGNVAVPLFDGNTLLHRERAADQALIQAAAQYRSTVITACQNVADTLHALYSDADALKAAQAAEQASKISLEMARKQYSVGYTSYLVLLNAEQAYQQTRISLITAQAMRLGDTAALFQALGGGWWNKAEN